MKIEIEISNNLKNNIDRISGKPIKEFCQEAVAEVVEGIQDDLILSCA